MTRRVYFVFPMCGNLLSHVWENLPRYVWSVKMKYVCSLSYVPREARKPSILKYLRAMKRV